MSNYNRYAMKHVFLRSFPFLVLCVIALSPCTGLAETSNCFSYSLSAGFTDSISNKDSKDSTAATRAAADLEVLKSHVEISKLQEEHIYNMFLSKHQFLERNEAVGLRWESRLAANKRRLQALLGEEAYYRLLAAGMIEYWFGVKQK